MIEENLFPKAVANDCGDVGLEETPTFENHEDNSFEWTPDEPPQELEPTPYLSTDVYLNVSIVLTRGYRITQGKVIRRKRNVDGNPISRENQNLILDTCQYEVQFADVEVKELTSNFIYEKMYAKFGEGGNDMLLLDCFVDYKKTKRALLLQHQQLMVNVRPCKKRSTDGWQICVFCKYQSTNWEKILVLKECYLVGVAEYAVLQNIDNETDFNWWPKHMLRI